MNCIIVDRTFLGCNEGDVMRVSCNTCVCSNGKYFCSKRDCNDKDIPLPPVQKASTRRKGTITYHNHKTKVDVEPRNETSSVEETTDPNATIFSDSINNETISQSQPQPLSQCIDGRTKPVDCNQCVCALGKWACTKASCIALSLREAASFNGGEFLKNAETLKEFMNMDGKVLKRLNIRNSHLLFIEIVFNGVI
jgi:hypothetical protein